MTTLRMRITQRRAPDAGIVPGACMADGTAYCGISPHSGHPFYAARTDVPYVGTWLNALYSAREFSEAHHYDWRLPTLEELAVLYKYRRAIGGFDEGAGYWSAGPHYLNIAWQIDFCGGAYKMTNKNRAHKARLVRGRDPYVQT